MQLRKMFFQIFNRLPIYLHAFVIAILGIEILRHHTHSRTYLQHRNIWARINSISYSASYTEVGQEVLTKIFLWTYRFHLLNCYSK